MTQETHREASRKNGQPTYVFVHGAGSNSFSWAPLLRELALLGHRTLAVDLPGHGFDAQFPISYQAPQDLEAFATEPSATKNAAVMPPATMAGAVLLGLACLPEERRNGTGVGLPSLTPAG